MNYLLVQLQLVSSSGVDSAYVLCGRVYGGYSWWRLRSVRRVSLCFLLIRHNREVRLLPLVWLVGLVRLVATRVNADFLVTCHSIDDEQVRGDLKGRWALKNEK